MTIVKTTKASASSIHPSVSSSKAKPILTDLPTPKTTLPKPQKTPNTSIKRILVSQPPSDTGKSPYTELAQKFGIQFDFHSFIKVEGLSRVLFKEQKINLRAHTAVIFSSRNAIEHYFRLMHESKIPISQDTKYFCVSESVALYLQKFTIYRKRKIFYGNDDLLDLYEIISKKHSTERFLFPYSNIEYKDFLKALNSGKIHYQIALMYKVLSNDLKDLFAHNHYDMICLFTQGGIKSFIENCPNFTQGACLIAVYGTHNIKLAKQCGLRVDIQAPNHKTPSMYGAIRDFLNARAEKKASKI